VEVIISSDCTFRFGFRRFSSNAWDDWLIFWWLIPFDEQLYHSTKMAAMPVILYLVSIDFLTNAWVDWSDFLLAHWG
jgi:hypothetical protein